MKLHVTKITSKQRMYLLFGLLFSIVFIFYSRIYPYSIWRMEGDNLLVFTPDFLESVLTSPAGVAEFVGLWLSQWYDNVILGIIIQSLLLSSIGILCFFTLRKVGWSEGFMGFSALPVVAVIGSSFFSHSPVMVISQIVFWLSLFLYTMIYNENIRICLFAILMPLLFFLLPGGTFVLLYICIAIHEIIKDVGSLKSWSYILFPFVALWIPALWNSLYFEQLGSRYSMFTHSEVPSWLAVLVFLPSVMFIKLFYKKILSPSWALVELCLIMIGGCVIISLDKVSRNIEESYHLEYLADNKMWNRIIQRCDNENAKLYDLSLKYSVLALIEMDRLPQLLFSLPVTPMFEYTFPTPNSRMTYGYNARFYQSLHLTNESMHCIFQDACMADYGMNFRDLRKMIECSVISNNKPLAEKYLSILSISNKNTDDYIKCVNSKVEKLPQLPQLFISSTDKNTLMRVLSSQFSTPVINDCLLCNLLIHKDLKTFADILPYCITTTQRIRGCYEEAAILCMANNIPCNIVVSENAKRAYADFNRLMENGQVEEIENLFNGSYWKYYYSEVKIDETNNSLY